MSFAERLKVARREKGYSQEQLAERLNVSRQSVTKWETENAFPELRTLLALSVLVEKDLDWLFSDELLEMHDLQEDDGLDSNISEELINSSLDETQNRTVFPATRSGYSFIDGYDGWRNGVYVLYGLPAIGKTAFALNIVSHIVSVGGRVAYFDLSRVTKNAIKMLLTIMSGVSNSYTDQILSESDKMKLHEAAEQISKSSLYIDHAYSTTVEEIHEKCINMKHLDVIVIDGAEHLSSSKSYLDPQRNDFFVLQELREIVRDCRCPIMVLKSPEGKAKKQLDECLCDSSVMSFLRDEECSEHIWLLQRRDYFVLSEEWDNSAALMMTEPFAKEDEVETIQLTFEKESLRFIEGRENKACTK